MFTIHNNRTARVAGNGHEFGSTLENCWEAVASHCYTRRKEEAPEKKGDSFLTEARTGNWHLGVKAGN